ncbi:MAG: UPF0182 family protein [Acidimicrobiales bacterium]
MRAESEMPRPGRRRARSGRRGRAVLITAAVLLFVLITSLRGIAGFYTDYLWFDSLGQSGVFTDVLGAKITLVVLFTATFFILLFVNLLIADRVAPAFRPLGPEEELVERYRQIVGTRTGLVRVGVSALFAIIAGAGASSQWNQWLLFRHGGDFGIEDPLFNRDVGFYVFTLPLLDYIVGWLFAALVIVLIVTGVAHYLNGGIRLQAPGPDRVTPAVRVHLSVLLGVLAIVKAVGYYLDRFELTVSTRGTVDGATYTDVNAQLPALGLLILIALGSCALFLLNIRRKGWVLPVIGVGLWAFVAVVAGAIVPAAVQRFRVEPSESSRERQYIERNMDATLGAMGLGGVEIVPFAGDETLVDADLAANSDVFRNIRLWDPTILQQTYQQLQALRPFYQITDVDVDRYEIDGELTQVMISTRELDTAGVPQPSWEARTLTFTHGYGVVLSPANAKDPNDRPDFAVSDVPLRDTAGIGVDRPGVYIGEGLSGYVIVNTNRQEIDFQDEDGRTQFESYDGEDGVGVGSFFRRAAFALRFGDLNPLVSGNLTDESRILYVREVRERLEMLAPFLTFDGDPYPVVVDVEGEGRIQWVVDAYTTTDRFPYGERAITDGLEDSGLDRRFNYVRNSVKAVVDAYDGSVTLYVIDPEDPIIQVYVDAFPELFETEEPPEELAAHFRYPEDLFRVQTNMWGRYHLEDPDDFYNNNGAWVVAEDPGTPAQPAGQEPTTTTTDPNAPPRLENRIDPYYLVTRLPGDESSSFVMLRPFVPVRGTRPLLTGFLVAHSDPDDYGRLVSFETPPSRQVDGPGVVAGTISNDPDVSQDQTLLCQRGTDCEFGNLVFVPMGESLLYVQPMYVIPEQNRLPLLRRVIVAFNGSVGYGATLRDAMLDLPQFNEVPETLESPSADDDEVVDDDADDADDTGDGDEVPESATIANLLAQANEQYGLAQEALRNGDLAAYQAAVDEMNRLIQEALTLAGGTTTTTTTTAPSESETTTTGEA